MNTYKLFSNIFATAMVISLLLSGCKKDSSPATSQVVASFSVVANGKIVTFTNTSENATSYLWKFGDGDTSHKTNPVHEYAAFGSYTATLTATNSAGSDSLVYKMTVTKSSPVSLTDNVITDWASVTTGYTNPTDLADNALIKMKYDYDATYVYVYVEQTGAISDSTIQSIYLDTDADSTTGFKSWVFPGNGNDYMLQGQLVSMRAIPFLQFAGPLQGDYHWTDLARTDEITIGAIVEENGVIKYEFGFLRDKFTFDKKKLNIGLVISNKSWAEIGFLPYKLQSILIDLTK